MSKMRVTVDSASPLASSSALLLWPAVDGYAHVFLRCAVPLSAYRPGVFRGRSQAFRAAFGFGKVGVALRAVLPAGARIAVSSFECFQGAGGVELPSPFVNLRWAVEPVGALHAVYSVVIHCPVELVGAVEAAARRQ